MTDTCVHHGESHDSNCPFCVVVKQKAEIETLTAKIEKFYRWFRMPKAKVDAIMENCK